MTYYSRKIEMPATRHQGLCNFVQMIINRLEAGEPREALLIAADLLDTLQGSSNPFASITSGKDNQMIEELHRQHVAEMNAAIERAHKAGFQDGEASQKRRLADLLGIAA